MKAQVLSDFLAECTWKSEDEASSDEEEIPKEMKSVSVLHVDGDSNATGCKAGLMLAEPDGQIIEYALRFSFHASNNQAEYEALLAGLRIAKDLGVRQLRAFSDSQLVVNQVNGEYAVKDPTMVQYLEKVQALSSQLEYFEIIHDP